MTERPTSGSRMAPGTGKDRVDYCVTKGKRGQGTRMTRERKEPRKRV